MKYSIVYVFPATSISIIYKINQNKNKEERRNGTTVTGISQKDLQINDKTEKEKNAKKIVEKRTRTLQACSGGSEKLKKTLN